MSGENLLPKETQYHWIVRHCENPTWATLMTRELEENDWQITQVTVAPNGMLYVVAKRPKP